MIEALEHDDDWYNEVEKSDDEPEPIVQTEIATTSEADLIDIEEKFDYLVKKKYNRVFLDQLTISQVLEEYEKCVIAEARGPTDPEEIGMEEGEWTQPDSIPVDEIPPEELRHKNPKDMLRFEMRDFLVSRNYPRKKLNVLGDESLRRLVRAFEDTERIQKRMVVLDVDNPEYLELTKRTRKLEPKEILNMELRPDIHEKGKELIRMFMESAPAPQAYNIPIEERKTWSVSRSVGDLVRSVLQRGQSVADLIDAMVAPASTKDVKILAWKYDVDFDAFLVKRVNAVCDVYHFFSSILQLPVQDLKELAWRGYRLESLIQTIVHKEKNFLSYRCLKEDAEHFENKKKKKEEGEAFLHEFSDKYFEKVTPPGLKVIDGT